METIVIKVDNKKNVTFLIKLLKKLNFVVEVIDQQNESEGNKVNELAFDDPKSKPAISDFAGLWEDRDITLKKLRERAWKRN